MEESLEIITLTSSDGADVDFKIIAVLDFEGIDYAIMQPAVLVDDMQEDEALVFEISESEEGEEQFTLVAEDRIIDGVFEEYNKIFEEEE